MRWKVAAILIIIQFVIVGCVMITPSRQPPLPPSRPLMLPRGVESPLSLPDEMVQSVFVPLVVDDVALVVGDSTVFHPSDNEQAFATLLLGTGQQRPVLRYSEILSHCARGKAESMASLNYLAHTSPDGTTPNQLARRCGYQMPATYGDDNNIESLAAGRCNAEQAFYDLLSSPPHRSHLLAEHEFYRAQTEYGIGYAYNAQAYYKCYWVVWIAEPGE